MRQPNYDFKWEEPPTQGRKTGLMADRIAQHLKKRPGQFARVLSYGNTQTASGSVDRLKRTLGTDEFEFTIRAGKVYGRFTGRTRTNGRRNGRRA